METLQNIQNKINETKGSWDDYNNQFQYGRKYLLNYAKQNNVLKSSVDDVKQANQQARETVIANNNALKQQTLGAKASTVALQALATVGNMILFTVISKGIELIAVGFDNFLHRAEKFKESAEEARQSVEEIVNSYKDLSAKVTDIKQRYAELAQGVNQTTGENKTLNTDEYAEFLDLSNQLAELFPSLTRKYTDNGDAILNLSGNVNTITSGLNDLVEAEKALANQQIIEKIPDILKGYNQNYFDITKDLADKKSWKDKLQTAYDSLQDTDKLYNSKVYDGDYAHIREVLNELGIEYSLVDEETGDAASFGRVSFSLYNYKNALDEISSALKIATKDVSNYNNKLKAENADFNKYLNTWLTNDWAYIGLHDSTLQDFVRDMLFNTDWLSEAKEQGINTTNWDDVSQWIEDNYILAIGNIDDERVKNALSKLYSLQPDLSPTQVKEIVDEYIPLIAETLGWDELELKIALGFEDADTIAKNYNAVIQSAAEKFSGINGVRNKENWNNPDNFVDYEKEKAALEAFAEENSINTQDEIAFWNQCIEESETKEKAMEKYLASPFMAVEHDNFIPTLSSSIEQLSTQLEPQFTKLGEAYNAIFTTDGFTLDAVDNSMLESLRKSFAEIGEEIGVTFDPTQLEAFFTILTDGGTEQEVQQAFNDLATAYLYSTDTLEQLNDETANAIEKQLEQMGVTNAEAVVAEALRVKDEELALSKKYLALEGKELAEATNSEVLAFMRQEVEAGNCGDALVTLQLKKLLANGTILSTEEDINNVMSFAKAVGISTTALSEFIMLKAELEKAQANVKSAPNEDKGKALKEMADVMGRMVLAQKQFEDDVNNFESVPVVDIEYKAPDAGKSSGSSSATSQAETDWKNVLDKETDLLEKQLAANVITFQEYTDKRRQIIEDYYRDGKIKAEDYYDALEDMYDHQLSLYDRAVNAVTDRIDDEIDKLKDQKEEIEKSYQVRIDAIQEEIDALNKTNDARQKQIDLEKAQYEAERARNQRVNKVYDGNQFVYAADVEAVRDAEDDLTEKEFQLNISRLETQIESLKAEMENATKSLDNQIEALEAYRDKWNEISGVYQKQQDKLLAAEIMGSEWERDVLNGRLDTLQSFTEQYIALQQAQADAAVNAARIKAEAEAGNATGGNVGSVNTGNNGINKQLESKKYEVIYEGTAKTVKTFDSLKDAQNYVKRMNKGIADDDFMYYIKKYASGTDHARKGLNLVGEDGTETFIDNNGNVSLVTKPTLIPMEGGEVVKNAEETKAMLDTDNLEPVPEKQSAEMQSLLQRIRNMPLSDFNFQSIMKPLESVINRPNIEFSPVLNGSESINIVQNNTINCPNVTNNSGAEYILKSLERLPLDNIQHSHRRRY